MVLFTQPLSLVSQIQIPLFCLRQGSEYLVEFFEGKRTQSFQVLADKPANTQIQFGYTLVDVDYFPLGYSGESNFAYSLDVARPRLCLNGFDLVEGASYFLEIAYEGAQILVPLRENAELNINPVILQYFQLEINIKTQVTVLGATVACPPSRVEQRVLMEEFGEKL